MSAGRVVAEGSPASLIRSYAGREVADVYGTIAEIQEFRVRAQADGLPTRQSGPALTSLHADQANGRLPEGARRAATLSRTCPCGSRGTTSNVVRDSVGYVRRPQPRGQRRHHAPVPDRGNVLSARPHAGPAAGAGLVQPALSLCRARTSLRVRPASGSRAGALRRTGAVRGAGVAAGGVARRRCA